MKHNKLKTNNKKPCSCPKGVPCPGCKSKRMIKPRIFLEEPKNVPIPIIINRYKLKKPNTVNSATNNRVSQRKKKVSYESNSQIMGINPKPIFKRLTNQSEGNHKVNKSEKARLEKVEDLLELVIKQQQNLEKHFNRTPHSATIQTEVKKKTIQPGKSVNVKPKAFSKSVAVKRENRLKSAKDRLLNFAYRACCKFYCFLSIILVLSMAIILVI